MRLPIAFSFLVAFVVLAAAPALAEEPGPGQVAMVTCKGSPD